MRKLLLASILILFAPFVSAQSIGMAPSSMQISDVEPGESYDFTVYLTVTGTSRNITVKPFLKHRSVGSLEDNDFVDLDEYSEQEVKPWIEWDQNRFEVNPSTSRTYNIPGGAVVADGTMSATLEVPENAEPGYRAIQIGVDPVATQGESFGASIFGLARMDMAFRVNGEAQRSIEVEDIEARRTGEDRVQFVFELQNTGTVTSSAGVRYSILDSRNRKLDGISTPGGGIPPKASRQMESIWYNENIEGGSYRLRGSVDYKTGESFFDETVSITQAPREPIQVDNPGQQQPGQQTPTESAPVLLILVAVLGVGSMLYASGFDIFWAFAVSGAAGIAIFIITGGLPLYVLLLGLIGATVLYIYW